MWRRCTNPDHPNWPGYGGRGIGVCERWKVFENFLADMGECPPGLEIDRFPNNGGNYETGSCRWATRLEQMRNSRTAKLTAEQVAALIRRKRAGEHRAVLAAEFGIRVRQVNNIAAGRSWPDVFAAVQAERRP